MAASSPSRSGASSPTGSTTGSPSRSAARDTAARYFPGDYELIPNGVLVPDEAEPAGREEQIVFVGRQEPRKGLQVLLRAWPEIRRRTGARLRVVGADPLAVRLLLRAPARVRTRASTCSASSRRTTLTAELLAAKALVAPSLGGESFGMVLTRAFACATPVVASDIAGLPRGHGARGRPSRAAAATRPRSPTRSSSCSRTSSGA